MKEQRIETNESPQIMIPECGGQVVVKSWRETAVSIQGDSFTVAENGSITITSQDDLLLAVPVQTRISLGVVRGDVTLKHLENGITGDELQGNVILNNVDAVQIDQIGQSLTAEDLSNTLEVRHVEGSVSLHRVGEIRLGDVNGSVDIEHATGPVELGQIEGNLTLNTINGDVLVANAFLNVIMQNLGGNNTLPSVIGDIWLVGGLSGREQLFVSDRSIYVYWPADAPMHLFANAPHIDNTLALSNENESQKSGQLVLTGNIEEGKTPLTLKAAYRIAIKPLGTEQPRFLPDDFMSIADSNEELTQIVRTAVHAVLADSLELVNLEERLVTAVVAALVDWEPEVAESEGGGETAVEETPVSQPEPQPQLYVVDTTESRSHILQLVRDGLLSIEQADLLLEALE
jgi:hypothetical protein